MSDFAVIRFCVLLESGEILEVDRIGLSATVAEQPQAVAVWRADAQNMMWRALVGVE